MSFAQDVTTWHNDNNRTGWQQNETILTPSAVSQLSFGLLWQWPVAGYVFAQPLAVTVQQDVKSCLNPCSLVFIATEDDMLYAFKAGSNSQSAVWSLDLANYVVVNGVHGTYVPCDIPATDPPCKSTTLGPHEGVTGTPVIDMGATPHPTLYVAAAVEIPGTSLSINFYLYAIDIVTGLPLGNPANNPIPIQGSVPGESPNPNNNNSAADCTSVYPGNGTNVTFEYHHIQRPGLLLLPNGKVYVAFSAGKGDNIGETTNGWIFGYSFDYVHNTFSNLAVFNSTPYGTGGGIWQAGAGPAYDGTYIYANTANGTLFDANLQAIPFDIGDSLLQLDPSTLTVMDFYAPTDALNYPAPNGSGLCLHDFDFGSGGVLVVPPPFTYNTKSILITADKQSNLYVEDQADLGKFNVNPTNNIQTLLTPHDKDGNKLDSDQGYWASPAYWRYTSGNSTTHWIYYSATTDNPAFAPFPIRGYQLVTSGPPGPILDPPTAISPQGFCLYSPTPSVSSTGTTAGTGIVWAIEQGNSRNLDTSQQPDCQGSSRQAALHAFDATTLTKLYNSRGLPGGTTGFATRFSTPTVFNGRVYVATQTKVNVFGLCTSCPH